MRRPVAMSMRVVAVAVVMTAVSVPRGRVVADRRLVEPRSRKGPDPALAEDDVRVQDLARPRGTTTATTTATPTTRIATATGRRMKC